MPTYTVDVSDLFYALKGANAGDVIQWEGVWDCRGEKIKNVRGVEGSPITLQGVTQDSAIIIGGNSPYFAARIEDCEWLRFGNCTIRDFTRDQARGVQVFTSDDIELFDLTTLNGVCDHVHIVGCNRVVVRRHRADGTGGRSMGGGKGPHSIYFTRVDGGPTCHDLVAEDCYCIDIYGAAFQANGDGGWLEGVVFRRVEADNYGEMGGSGANLAQCRSPLLEDITLFRHPRNGNPGVNSYDGTTGTVMRRYIIDASPHWEGPMQATAGTPAPPDFSGTTQPPTEPPPTEPPPDPLEPGEQYCPSCEATGVQLAPDGTGTIPCATCGGSGRIPQPT